VPQSSPSYEVEGFPFERRLVADFVARSVVERRPHKRGDEKPAVEEGNRRNLPAAPTD
jgi:hypothetical protein